MWHKTIPLKIHMWLLTLFRAFSSCKKQRHIFCYNVSWVDHIAYSCKQKAQTRILCILVTIWYGQNLKRGKKNNQQTKQKLHKENHLPPKQGYERWQGAVCIPMCRFHCWQEILWHGRRDKFIPIFTRARNSLKSSLKKKKNTINSQVIVPFLDSLQSTWLCPGPLSSHLKIL